ncbi:hypothetical protein AX16_009706 [Volvariella volvacea WC 439]|nr:hypothetical protein AX16_009706 [Volvariella volvacea WC 439]
MDAVSYSINLVVSAVLSPFLLLCFIINWLKGTPAALTNSLIVPDNSTLSFNWFPFDSPPSLLSIQFVTVSSRTRAGALKNAIWKQINQQSIWKQVLQCDGNSYEVVVYAIKGGLPTTSEEEFSEGISELNIDSFEGLAQAQNQGLIQLVNPTQNVGTYGALVQSQVGHLHLICALHPCNPIIYPYKEPYSRQERLEPSLQDSETRPKQKVADKKSITLRIHSYSNNIPGTSNTEHQITVPTNNQLAAPLGKLKLDHHTFVSTSWEYETWVHTSLLSGNQIRGTWTLDHELVFTTAMPVFSRETDQILESLEDTRAVYHKKWYWFATSDYPEIDAIMYDRNTIILVQTAISAQCYRLLVEGVRKVRDALPPEVRKRRLKWGLLVVAPDPQICKGVMEYLVFDFKQLGEEFSDPGEFDAWRDVSIGGCVVNSLPKDKARVSPRRAHPGPYGEAKKGLSQLQRIHAGASDGKSSMTA